MPSETGRDRGPTDHSTLGRFGGRGRRSQGSLGQSGPTTRESVVVRVGPRPPRLVRGRVTVVPSLADSDTSSSEHDPHSGEVGRGESLGWAAVGGVVRTWAVRGLRVPLSTSDPDSGKGSPNRTGQEVKRLKRGSTDDVTAVGRTGREARPETQQVFRGPSRCRVPKRRVPTPLENSVPTLEGREKVNKETPFQRETACLISRHLVSVE